MQLYPALISALVPIYRLDALGANASPLVFTRHALAQIYLGEIQWWNDTRLVQNNSIVMPNQKISMVLAAASPLAGPLIWSTALGKFYPSFAAAVPASTLPAWPVHAYANVIRAPIGGTSQAATVIANDGSIGYSFLSVAMYLNAQIGSMVNQAGNTVAASTSTVTFAAVELGTQARSRGTEQMDLTDATGSSVWPITMATFVLIDTVTSRSTCHVRQAVVEFLLWLYTSSVVTTIIEARQYAPVPSVVLSHLDVVSDLTNNVYCRGNTALPLIETNTRLIGAPISLSFLLNLLSSVYQDSLSTTTTTWEVQQASDQVVLEQMVNAEVDVALINPYNVDAMMLATIEADPMYLILPMFLTGVTVVFNPQLNSSVHVASQRSCST